MLNSMKMMIGVIGSALLFSSTAFAAPTLPEPGTASMLLVGGAGLYFLYRKRS